MIGFVLPLRHFESGAQLIDLNGCRFAYGTTVSQPACFAGFDRIGNAQLLSLVGLALAGGAGDTLTEAKKNWLYAPPLQGLRRLMEELLVEPDWAAGVIGLDLVDAQLYPLLYEHLDDRALAPRGHRLQSARPTLQRLVRHRAQMAHGAREGVGQRCPARRGQPESAR